MSQLIDIRSYPVNKILNILLQDKTTKKNIIWATDTYADRGAEFSDASQITKEALLGLSAVELQPRIEKALEEQQARTRKRAEVFSPVWLIALMNNHIDEEWFGRRDVFNVVRDDHQWDVVKDKIGFPEEKTWQQYVDSRRLEITCGEAPYLVSRYDAATGELILPPLRRIGILDRKLRIVNENAESEEDWVKWTVRAFQSIYGYEYQGDSLLIGRINLVMTFYDYYKERFNKEPDVPLLKKIANIVSWNLWQMDGLKDTVPLGKPYEEFHQATLFEVFGDVPEADEDVALPCRIMNWRSNAAVVFKNLKG